MKFQKQHFLHRPDDGLYGDCWRTVIACALDLAPDDVPHFGLPDGGGMLATHNWLSERGLHLICINFNGTDTMESVLLTAEAATFDDQFYFFSGKSKTGCNHVVIAQGDKIVWDPSLTDAGIVGPLDNGFWSVEWLVRSPSLQVAA